MSSNASSHPPYDNFSPGPPPQNSGKAIASLICGLLSLVTCALTGIPAFILGLMGLGDIGRSEGRLTGRGMAITGMVLGVFGTMMTAIALLMALLLPAVQAAREAARISVSQNNLRQIGAAMLNFEQTRRRFPKSADKTKPDAPAVSWRVMITPYIERADLWRAYTENLEPWDSEKNKELINRMPELFRSPGDPDAKPGMTNYVAIVGDETAFPESDGAVGVDDITQNDGMSNTLLVVEVTGLNIPWTEPRDMPIEDFIKGINQPGGPQAIYSRGINAVFADGSVRMIDVKTLPDTLKAMATYNGHEQSR